MTAWSAQHNGKFPDPFSKLKLDHEKNKDKKKKKKKDKKDSLDEKPDNFQPHDANNKTVSPGPGGYVGGQCDQIRQNFVIWATLY